VEAGDASPVEVVVVVAVAAVGRMRAVLWLAGRSSVVLAEVRSTAGAQVARQGRTRKGCSLSLVGSGFAVGRSLGGSLRRRWAVGSLAYCRASGGRFGIGALLVGWQLGYTWTAEVVCCKKSEIEEVVGGGLQEIGDWVSWSAAGVMG
jgi:hypothetical protein